MYRYTDCTEWIYYVTTEVAYSLPLVPRPFSHLHLHLHLGTLRCSLPSESSAWRCYLEEYFTHTLPPTCAHVHMHAFKPITMPTLSILFGFRPTLLAIVQTHHTLCLRSKQAPRLLTQSSKPASNPHLKSLLLSASIHLVWFRCLRPAKRREK